jgi:hypothetical protein
VKWPAPYHYSFAAAWRQTTTPIPTRRSVEIVGLTLANVGHRVSYMAAAMRGSVLGKVGEHLHGKAAVEAIGDLPPPRSPHDLRRHATRGSGLGVDQSASLYRLVPRLL